MHAFIRCTWYNVSHVSTNAIAAFKFKTLTFPRFADKVDSLK